MWVSVPRSPTRESDATRVDSDTDDDDHDARDHRGAGECACEDYAADESDGADDERWASLHARKCHGRRVRDRVVQQDSERRESDGATDICGRGDDSDNRTDGEFGVMRHAEAGVNRRQRSWQVLSLIHI